MALRVIVLYGGVSPEHDVSCISAHFISEVLHSDGCVVLPVYIDKTGQWHLQKKKKLKSSEQIKNPCFLHSENQRNLATNDRKKYEFDIIFPIIHGRTGEDGRLQGLLEFLDIPYVGAGVFTSSTCMDKFYTKTLLKSGGFPVAPYMRVDQSDWLNWPNQVKNEILGAFSLPLFVKPCNMGSSIGVSKVKSSESLVDAIQHALKYDSQVIIEKFINARELEISIMGNHPNYKVSCVGEIIVNADFYSYQTKYMDDQASFQIPADITGKQSDLIRDMATAIFQMFHGDGFARIDFFLSKEDNIIYVNEINTLPGFTPISMFPKLWENIGISSKILISNLIDLGLEKYEAKKSIQINLVD